MTTRTKTANGSACISPYYYAKYVPPERITVEVADYIWGLRNIELGDWITVVDENSGLIGSFRVFGREFAIEEGYPRLTLELGTGRLSVTEAISNTSSQVEEITRSTVGSTVYYVYTKEDNAESGSSEPSPVTLYFCIPSELVQVNSVKLSYMNLTPRTWNTTTNNYDMNNPTSYSTSSISIYTYDGSAWTDRTSAIQSALGRSLRAGNGQYETGIDLTSFIGSTGWKGVRIVTNGNSRHFVQVEVKGYVIPQ